MLSALKPQNEQEGPKKKRDEKKLFDTTLVMTREHQRTLGATLFGGHHRGTLFSSKHIKK